MFITLHQEAKELNVNMDLVKYYTHANQEENNVKYRSALCNLNGEITFVCETPAEIFNLMRAEKARINK